MTANKSIATKKIIALTLCVAGLSGCGAEGDPTASSSSSSSGSSSSSSGTKPSSSSTSSSSNSSSSSSSSSTSSSSSSSSSSGRASSSSSSSSSSGSSTRVSGVQGYSGDVTGGGNNPSVTVSSLTALQDAIKAYSGSGGLVVLYTGKFDFAPIKANICEQWPKDKQEVEIKDKNNITILGSDGSAANFGIRIKGTSSNIIIRNMTIGLLPGGSSDGDAIGIEGGSKIWVDHNELFSANKKCPGTPDDDTTFEGLIDIKKTADNITVSYNYIHDHWKVGLDGSSDTDTTARHITYHHNRYENVAARLPLQRFGFTHIYSNYYNGITESGINVRMGGQTLIESNYFYDAKNPLTSRSSSEIGFWDLRNNNIKTPADFTQYKISWTSGSGTWKNADAWTTTKAFPALPYKYTADVPAHLECIAKATAGASKGLKTAADVTAQCGN